MIVNDTYSLELRSFGTVATGETVGLMGRVEHDFLPQRLDMGRKHGQRKWQFVSLFIGDVEVRSEVEVEDAGKVRVGTMVSMVVKNVSPARERASIFLIGTVDE